MITSPPIILIDSREQAPLSFRNLQSRRATLYSGDYSAAGLENSFAVERKSVGDLVACCVGEARERFERELHRLRGFRFKRLLIVGAKLEIEQHRYRSNIAPKAVLNTLSAFEARYDIPVVWEPLPDKASELIESWAWWLSREVMKAADAIRKPVETQPDDDSPTRTDGGVSAGDKVQAAPACVRIAVNRTEHQRAQSESD